MRTGKLSSGHIEISCTDDNFTGSFEIEPFRFRVLNAPGIADGNAQYVSSLAGGNRAGTPLVNYGPRTSEPITRFIRYEGNYDIRKDMPSRVYVGLGLWMQVNENGEICIGDSCLTENDNLLDQAVFSVSALEFEMVRN